MDCMGRRGRRRRGHNARQVPICQITSLIAPHAHAPDADGAAVRCALYSARHHCQILISRNWPRGRRGENEMEGRNEVWMGGRMKKRCGRFRAPIHWRRARGLKAISSRGGASQIVHYWGRIRGPNVITLLVLRFALRFMEKRGSNERV